MNADFLRAEAQMYLERIRYIDARLMGLDLTFNYKVIQFEFDLDDVEILSEYGFGLDPNGSYPSL